MACRSAVASSAPSPQVLAWDRAADRTGHARPDRGDTPQLGWRRRRHVARGRKSFAQIWTKHFRCWRCALRSHVRDAIKAPNTGTTHATLTRMILNLSVTRHHQMVKCPL